MSYGNYTYIMKIKFSRNKMLKITLFKKLHIA